VSDEIRKQFELNIDRRHFPISKDSFGKYKCKRTRLLWESYLRIQTSK